MSINFYIQFRFASSLLKRLLRFNIMQSTLKNFQTRPCKKSYKIFIDERAWKQIQLEAEKCPFQLKYLQITTCRELYQTMAAKGYKRPIDGVKFNVAYVDSRPDASKEVPVVVCLHGSPGGHWDFNNLMIDLNNAGARVIVVNFPGYGMTKKDEKYQFRSTGEEKATFVKDFLKELNITKVAMGIGHSVAVYPSLILSSEPFNMCQSMVLLNPANLADHKLLPPNLYIKIHSEYYRYPILRPLLLLLVKIHLILSGNKMTNAHHASVGIETVYKVPYEKHKGIAASLCNRKFPMTVIHALNDRITDTKRVEEFVGLLGGNEDTVFRYNASGKLISEAKNGGSFIHEYVFESGGHYVMKKYPKEVNNIVLELFRKIVGEKK